MGFHAGAKVGWFVDLYDGEYGELNSGIAQKLDEEDYGFDEYVDDWSVQMQDAGISVSDYAYGNGKYVAAFYFGGDSSGYGETQIYLGLDRHVDVYEPYELKEITPGISAPPTEVELDVLNRALDWLGFDGDRVPRLALFSTYG